MCTGFSGLGILLLVLSGFFLLTDAPNLVPTLVGATAAASFVLAYGARSACRRVESEPRKAA